MCTTNLVKVEGEHIGWKVVCKNNLGVGFRSVFRYYQWSPNTIHETLCSRHRYYVEDDEIFHCFARRSDARKLKRQESNAKIIKVVLSGEVFKGLTRGMGARLMDLPAICGRKAFWDGRFHS